MKTSIVYQESMEELQTVTAVRWSLLEKHPARSGLAAHGEEVLPKALSDWARDEK